MPVVKYIVDVPIPAVSEQEKIVSMLSNIDNKKQKENHRKEILFKLKKGLMQKLLTGKIRVKV